MFSEGRKKERGRKKPFGIGIIYKHDFLCVY